MAASRWLADSICQPCVSSDTYPVSSPFCHSPPPESREIANELAHGLLSSIRVCGKCAGTQYKTSLNQPKTQMLNAMFSRLYFPALVCSLSHQCAHNPKVVGSTPPAAPNALIQVLA